jgi:putative Holliday junction resolvase
VTRLLGIDLGARRIGLAVADTDSGAVRPLATISRATADRDARTLGAVVREQRIDELVVGLPRNMDGSEGEQAIETRRWAEEVLTALCLPVSWRDERLTSSRAEDRLGRAPRGRAGGPPSGAARAARRATIDREAAALIVQAELDARAGMASDA